MKRDPLAMGNARSFAKDDYVEFDVPIPKMGLEEGKKGDALDEGLCG